MLAGVHPLDVYIKQEGIKMATKPATPEQFVKVWQKSSTRWEAAKELGVNLNTVSTRAKTYRLKGIPLKAFKRIVIPKRIRFGAQTSPGVTSLHRSRKGFAQSSLDVKGLIRLAKRSLHN